MTIVDGIVHLDWSCVCDGVSGSGLGSSSVKQTCSGPSPDSSEAEEAVVDILSQKRLHLKKPPNRGFVSIHCLAVEQYLAL